jgi:hypothetical protein
MIRRRIGHLDLPFDFAWGGESFDAAQDREPDERLFKPFEIWILVLGIFMNFIRQVIFIKLVNYFFR